MGSKERPKLAIPKTEIRCNGCDHLCLAYKEVVEDGMTEPFSVLGLCPC